MSTKHAEVIVIGAGGVGSMALKALGDRGVRAIGLDRFAPPHDRGSSHGDTRVIRLAYLEHPDYVPLLRRAYDHWAELEAQSKTKLYDERGLLQVGPPEGHVVAGVKEAARIHRLEIDEYTAEQAQKRFPGLRVPVHMSAVFERRAGFLWVEKAIQAALEQARASGTVTVDTGVTVRGWREEGGGITVDTDHGPYTAERIIVCPGAWAPDLLGELGVPFEIRRKTLLWFDAPPDDNPVWLFDMPGGVFYGFPSLPGSGLKAALHTGGDRVVDPLGVDREIHASDRAPVEAFIEAHLVNRGPYTRGKTCLYTLTPDEHFVVDQHPRSKKAVVVCGLSGHGFKLASALGAIAVELAIDGVTESPIDFLRLSRF